MFKYFDESMLHYKTLKIYTTNNKTMTNVLVICYSSDTLYYHFKTSTQSARISLSKISHVEFNNKEDQIELLRKELGLPFNTSTMISYYKKCIATLEEDSSYDFKKNMYENILDSIYMQQPKNLLVRYFKNQKEQKIENENNNLILLSNSNISQRRAIKNALNNDVSIIQGPPGTGKTTTILSLIANLIMNGKKVVVVSKNNSAVDNIVEDFEKTELPEFYLRYGRKKDYMTPLQNDISNKLKKLKYELSNIPSFKENVEKLSFLQNQLKLLESEIDELIDIKNLIVDLKTQKKFMDREQELYNFKDMLTENEMKIICEKNASKKRLARIFYYSKKNKFNFFQRLIIKYYYCLEKENFEDKFFAIYQLLKEVYMRKEIADRETYLLEKNLIEKQKRVENIYEEYTEVCMKSFASYLRNSMISGLNHLTSVDLSQLTFDVYPLILTTADAFLSNFSTMIKKNESIDAIIIDEASQCDIITGLPLLHMAKKLIVVGDEKQLSAITDLKIETDLPQEYRYDDNTFLNSVKNVFDPIEQTLEEHYRCDYNIISFCNKFYYDNKLKIYTNATPSSIEIVDADKYKGADSRNGSFYNERECHTIESLVNKQDDYFVITPYKEQGNLLKSKFEPQRAGTIHTFQGKGAKKVYFSTVLNDLNACNIHIRKGHNMFTKELVNVAVSRAKQKFVLVTDKKYFQENSLYVKEINNLIDYIKIYGQEIDDKTSCIYDYLYKTIPFYKKSIIYENKFEEVTHRTINTILDDTSYECCAKIYLTELILNEQFLKENPDIKSYIKNKAHADFSIFDKRTGKLKLVIELDGKDHKKEEQKIKDQYKDAAFASISIPVLRIKSKSAIDADILKRELKKYIDID